MFAFLVAQPNLPYAICLALVITFAIFEIVALFAGISLSNVVDTWAPWGMDQDLAEGNKHSLMEWLSLDKLPLVIWFLLAVISFCIAGYGLNLASIFYHSIYIPEVFTMPIAMVIACISCRYLGVLLAKYVVKRPLHNLKNEDLSGCLGTITLGCAMKGNPGEAVVKDSYQSRHYVLVEPDIEGVEFKEGSQVVLLRNHGRVWSATQFNY